MILVTGGAGFVGPNLIAGLESRGHRGIAVYDRLGAGARWRNLARRAVGTVFSPERLSGFLEEAGGGVEAVYHIGLHEGARARSRDPARPLWIGDCVAVMLWLLDNMEVSGLFNVGTGQGRRIDEVAAAVASAAGKELEIAPGAEPVEGRYRHSTEARVERLRNAGYGTRFLSIETGIGRYVGDYLSRGEAHL